MTLSTEQITALSGENVKKLSELFSVIERRDLLEKHMSSKDVEECILSGLNNQQRMERLCFKIKLYKNEALLLALADYFLLKSDEYKAMCNHLMQSKRNHSDVNGIDALKDNTEAITIAMEHLKEKVQDLSMELQYCRSQANTLANSFSNLNRENGASSITSYKIKEPGPERNDSRDSFPLSDPYSLVELDRFQNGVWADMPPLLCSSSGEYGIHWRILNGSMKFTSEWRQTLNGDSAWLGCSLLLPQQLRGNNFVLWLGRVKNNLVIISKYHHNTPRSEPPTKIKATVLVKIYQTGIKSSCWLKQGIDGSIEHRETILATFKSLNWNSFDCNILPSCYFRLLLE